MPEQEQIKEAALAQASQAEAQLDQVLPQGQYRMVIDTQVVIGPRLPCSKCSRKTPMLITVDTHGMQAEFDGLALCRRCGIEFGVEFALGPPI